MSSTRRSTTGRFHQERFCSAPEFEGDAINGLAAAKRIAIVPAKRIREVLWFIQWRSLTPGALQELCEQILTRFPDRVGTPTFRSLRSAGDRILTGKEVSALESEFGDSVFSQAEFLAACGRDSEDREEGLSPISEFSARLSEAVNGLREQLMRFCLDPAEDLVAGVWYFDDLVGALIELRQEFIERAQKRMAKTAITEKINETLDFFYFCRDKEDASMVLIEGGAGLGKSESARAWSDAHAGMVRLVEVPSSSDDRSFFASIARSLGVARGASFKAQQIKVRVEEMLATSDLLLILDEAQYLWGQAMRPRKTPDRMLWVNSLFNAGSPVALMGLPDFTTWQEHFVERTLWTDAQFERRLNRRIALPKKHSTADMLRIAKAHFPEGDARSLKLLASYGLAMKKKQASGIREALKSARFRAHLAGRSEANFADVEAAVNGDHGLRETPADEEMQETGTPVATSLQVVRKGPSARPDRIASTSDFSSHPRLSGGRATTPATV